jgi:hypothetical protein
LFGIDRLKEIVSVAPPSRFAIVPMRWPLLPDYGCFARWPEDGSSFIHPDDRAIVTRVIPSERVFRRDHFDDVYYHYSYGRIRFRLRPAMWLKIKTEGFDVGDEIETIAEGMTREAFVGSIWGMYFIRRKSKIFYRLKNAAGNPIPRLYPAEHMRLIRDKAKVRPGDSHHPQPLWTGNVDDSLPLES